MRPLLALALLVIDCGPAAFERVPIDDGRDLRSIDISDDGDGLIVGRNGAAHTYAGGAVVLGTYSFEDDLATRTPDLFAAVVHRGARWAVGEAGTIIRLDTEAPDEESPFIVEPSGTGRRLLTAVEVTPTQLLAAGERGTVRERGTNGVWSSVDASSPSQARITGAWSAGRTVVMTTDLGVILERTATGAWSAQTITTETTTVPVPLFDVWSSTTGADVYVVGLGGALFRRRNGGTEWRQMETPAAEDLYALDGVSDDEVYAVGAVGTILRFDGTSWSRLPSATGRDLFGVRVRGAEVVAVGDGGTIVRRVE